MYRVTTTLTGIPGSPYYSVFNFDQAGTTLPQDAADATIAWWQAVDNLFANDLTWTVPTLVEVVNTASGETEAVLSVTGATGTGADTTSYLPQINQALIRWRTGVYVGGREIRGRTFLPGLTEAASNDGVLDSTWVSTLNTANAALLGDADSVLGVYSRAHAQIEPVTAAQVWTSFASLRSRRD